MSTIEPSNAGTVNGPAEAPGPSAEALARGDVLGRYIVIERLGAGAAGVVYGAYDPELDRKVAIKILRRQGADAGESRRQARFVREAKAIAKLAHPNVVGIFDVGVANGQVFLAMEYMSGGTLRAWMTAKRRPWREILKMFVEVGRGLAAAHAERLVHRDFKPDNVLIDRAGTPKVADFGMARLSGGAGDADDDSQDGSPHQPQETPETGALTRTGAIAGTPAYMAPEQFLGRQTDGRTDQFAFCVALYEGVYGQRPFEEGTVFDLADAVIRERIQPAPKAANNVPGWLRRSLLRGLRADPAGRYAKIEDLLAALQADPVARVRKFVVGSVVAAILVGSFLGLYRRSERRRVEFEGRIASKLNDGRQALSEAVAIKQRLGAARGRALTAFDGARREEGESSWAEARAAASKLESTLKRAQSALEAALALDQSNEVARATLGATLFERASLAELEFRKADVAHHVELMQHFDQSGGLLARWMRAGSVDIRTMPPGARIVIEKYDASDDMAGTLRAVRVGDSFVSPGGERPLPPGSYRLTATLDGFVQTRLPFLVHRGQAIQIDLPLLASSEVPPDFVYVPAGRFLFGDAEEEWRVAFLNAVPIHERSTGPFLIKAHETTFREWLEFLRDLPPAERRVRTPSSVIVQGGIAVKGSPEKGWSLELKISGEQALTAREGTPLFFSGRKVRASQDWLRMPVVGVSQPDMQAYVEWLARTGRVRGARFCSEVEWERAARGADERSYPGSQRRLERDDANIDETYGRVRGSFGPDEVGAHPRSESPFGIQDMAGNVWEMVKSSEDEAAFTIRGGSYYQGFIVARATNREPVDLDTSTFLVGLRICAATK